MDETALSETITTLIRQYGITRVRAHVNRSQPRKKKVGAQAGGPRTLAALAPVVWCLVSLIDAATDRGVSWACKELAKAGAIRVRRHRLGKLGVFWERVKTNDRGLARIYYRYAANLDSKKPPLELVAFLRYLAVRDHAVRAGEMQPEYALGFWPGRNLNVPDGTTVDVFPTKKINYFIGRGIEALGIK